jgi:hypothetical protein
MVWLTYRQHRLEFGALLVGALALVVALIALAQYFASVRVAVGLDSCPAVFGTPECVVKFTEYQRQTSGLRGFIMALYAYPVIVAGFLAPVIFSRDFERGTHRLVWTQGITRMRWVWTKLAIGFAMAVVAALTIAAFGGQAGELQQRTDQWANFDFQGPAFVSYLVFAVALGAALGVLLRRTILTMLASLLLFLVVRTLVEWKLRPNFLPPVAIPAGGPNLIALPQDAWHLGVRYVYTSGADFPQEQYDTLMRNFRGGDLYAYLRSHDVVAMSYYHPADQYWLFQSIEAAIFLALSALLVLVTVWLVRRRA